MAYFHRILLWLMSFAHNCRSIVVEHIRRQRTKKEMLNKEVGVAMMYLKYTDHQQTLENILGSLLAQLAQDLDPLPPFLRDLYEKHRAYRTSPTLSDLSIALSDVSNLYKRIYVIVDALDECTDDVRWELMEKLREIEPRVHLLVTSRDLDSIEEELQDFERLEIKANKADLELFIDHHIQKNKNLRKIVQKSPTIKEDIKVAVVTIAEDMYSSLQRTKMPGTFLIRFRFLLARLHVESLGSAAAISIKYVRKKLQSLPATLTGTYDEAMQRIEAQDPDHTSIALKTLAWVSYAFRSLSLGELQHALAIEPESTRIDEEDMIDGNSITALCAGLVVVDQGTNTVTLVHYTASKYFEDVRANRFPGFHATITMSCATYLALSALGNSSIWAIVRQYPLACYAAQYMGDHARHNPEDALEPSILEVIGKLLSHPDKQKPLISLLDGLDLIRSGFYSGEMPQNVSETIEIPNEATAAKAMGPSGEKQESAEHIAMGAAEMDVHSVTGRSELSTATTLCNVSELVNVTSEELSRGDLETESQPWQSRASVNRMPEVTALHLAASMGLAKVASLLIRESGDIDAVDDTGKTALALAMERGFERAVEFLINSGASVDLGSGHGQGIFLLVTERNWDTVAGIIAHKARSNYGPDAGCDLRQKAAHTLLAAYDGNHQEISSLITEASLGLEVRDSDVRATALFIAVERKHISVAETLLSSGIDVNSRDSVGQTSLHRATHCGHEEMIRFLIKYGADIDCQNDDGRTPWSANVRGNNEIILKLLLDAGADPSTKGHQGVSELYIAAQNGETSVVKLMLDSGTDPSIRTQFGWAPLHWAAYYGHVDCVRLLIEAGAELSPVSDQDASPLDLALRANQVEVFDILTRAGAKESRDVQALSKIGEEVDKTESTPRNVESGSDSSTKVSLTFDKPVQQGLLVGQFIYPSTFLKPKSFIYQLSQPLETLSAFLSIRIAQRRADMVEYPIGPEGYDSTHILYDIWRSTIDYQRLQLRGGTQSSFSGVIDMHRDWTGGWKVRHDHNGESEYLFRTTPDWSRMKEEGCRWMTEEGKLLARTGVEDVTPTLCFEHGLQRGMQDVLVSCWVGKLWSETVAIPRKGGEKASQA